MLNRAGPWRIGGATLVAQADVAEDLQPLSQLLAGFGRATAAEGDKAWRALLRRRPPQPLRRGDGLRHGHLLSGEPYEARIGRCSRFVIDRRLRLTLDPRRRLALCQLAEDGAPLLAGEGGLMIVDAVVELQGQHMLHAALLAMPDALGGGGLVLLGDSGAGKTTTSLALALGGFALGGDDAAILCGTADGLAAWALPRRLKIHREVAGFLPALAPHLPPDREESAHDPASLATQLALVRPADRLLPLRAFAWLGPRSAGQHGHRRLTPIEMLARLAGRDLHAPRALADRSVERQLALFAEAAREVAAFELSLGRDLVALPAWLGSVLAAEL